MLLQEAEWWRGALEAIDPASLYPMLNVGSSTARFRTVEQPFIDEILFRPIKEQGRSVIHLDTKADPGVDIVGDVTEEDFRNRLMGMGFKSVFCSHLLEHVPDATRTPLCAAITRLLPNGGFAFISCPRRFPYHPDPIDTRFRPTAAELAALFPGTVLTSSSEVFG